MAIHKMDGAQGVNHFPRKFVRIYDSVDTGAIALGQTMILDLAAAITPTSANGGWLVRIANAEDSPLVCGVAAEAQAAAVTVNPDGVLIQYAGFNNTCTADSGGAIALAALVGTATGGGNGRVQTAAGWTDAVVPMGVCVDAFTASTADGAISIWDRAYFG